MKDNFKKLINILGERRVLLNEYLSKYTSIKIGGPADIFYRARKVEDLVLAISSARKLSVPFFLMGGGTNVLVGDTGFRGLIVKNDTESIKLLGLKAKKGVVPTVYLEVESGVTVNRLVRFTLDQGFSGLENFLGQPGSVGGAVYINAHNLKKGVYFGENIIEAKILDKNNNIKTVPVSYFRFGYDFSCVQNTLDTVLSVIISLKRSDKEFVWKKASEVLNYRQSTQPTGVYSSGCTFRNINKSDAIRLATPNMTTSTGYLLDRVGLKGVKVGEAMFSDHHANFIIHRGGAKARDMLELIRMAKNRVKEKFGIDLKEEIIFVGDF